MSNLSKYFMGERKNVQV